MKIYQLLPTLAFGDAVSNDALALEKVIQKMGYKTEIFAESLMRACQRAVQSLWKSCRG